MGGGAAPNDRVAVSRPQKEEYMRFRKRAGVVLASAAALGVGLIAFPASSAAAPPVVQTCVPKASTGSDSCAKLVGQATGR